MRGLPVSGVLGHYGRGPSGPRLPLWPWTLGTEATFKHGHYVESADIVTARYQSLVSWSFDPGVADGGGGGMAEGMGRRGWGNCTPD